MRHISFFALVLLVLLAACAGPDPKTGAQIDVLSASERADRVILISVDGLGADILQDVNPPLLDFMRTKGAVTFSARTVFPSQTTPGHASMLSGLTVWHHGIFFNTSPSDDSKISVPTIFTIAEANGLRGAAIVGTSRLNTLIQPTSDTDAHLYLHVHASRAVVETAKQWTRPGRREFIFLHFDGVDHAGHKYGWGSSEQKEQVREICGAIMNVLIDPTLLDGKTLLIITADHGGSGHGHGTMSEGDTVIPWMAYGPMVRAGHEISTPVAVYDTAATALYALGISRPPMDGKVIQELFSQ